MPNDPVDTPIRFVPFLRPMVWGGRKLGDVLGKPLCSLEAYGESWELSDHPLHRSVVATEPHAGRSLRQLMEQERARLLGSASQDYATFPWLIKFLDCTGWLSVQVHPDEAAVKRFCPGEGTKTEAWFVLDAVPGSRIYAGLLPGVDEGWLRAALAAGTVTRSLHSFEPRPGDCLFLPAGTVHAVGGGVLIAEVQQTSDATFRLFDWNRRDVQGKRRPLHIEESLASIDWTRGPVEPIHTEKWGHFAQSASKQSVPNFRSSETLDTASTRQLLVRCPCFVLEIGQESKPFAVGGEERLQVLIVVSGRARPDRVNAAAELSKGQVWLLPAAMSRTWYRPTESVTFLLCSLPECSKNGDRTPKITPRVLSPFFPE